MKASRQYRIIALLLLLCMLFASCSSGGGGSTGTTADTNGSGGESTTPPPPGTAGTTAVTEPQGIDTSSLSFLSITYLYDGEEKTLSIFGTLPEGVTVRYENNTRTEPGESDATAILSKAGCEDVVLSAKLSVIVSPLTGISFPSGQFVYDGQPHSIGISGELPEGVSVSYTGNGQVNAGTYTVTATFESDDRSIGPLPSMNAQIQIAKADFDLTGVRWSTANSFVADGKEKSVYLENLPAGLSVRYLENRATSAGLYMAVASLVPDHPENYNTPETMQKSWAIVGHSEALVRYHLAGGVVAETGATSYETTFKSPYHLCYNTVGDVGTFVRDGYTLLEYNTAADGSGTPVNPGGIVPVPDSGVLELWAVWGKWTPASDFTYTTGSDGVTITSYKKDAETVIIPASVNGKAVTAIAAGAFTNKHFVTLSIPRSVQTVEGGAFSGCSALDVLYLCDNIRNISDDSFRNCRAFTSFCYNAGMGPTSPGGEPSFAYKFELCMTEKHNLIVVVSGSSSLNGLNSPLLEEKLFEAGYDYRVVNYGTNQGSNGVLYMEAVSHFLDEGDILICASEHGGIQYGQTKMAWKTFRATERCYNIFRYVDMSHYTGVFSAIYELNVTNGRLKSSEKSYSINGTGQNSHGDTVSNTKHTNFSRSGSVTLSAGLISDSAAKGFNIAFDALADAGVKVYFSFPPYLEDAFKKTADIEGYINSLQKKLHCTLISFDPIAYLLPYELMFNSNYHPTAAGAAIRSEILAGDILAQFAREEQAANTEK